jgi:hypothetical protein
MSDSRLCEVDPVTGIQTFFPSDDGDDAIAFSREQDVTSVIEHNKAFANDAPERWNGGEMHRVASIPLIIYQELEAKGITKDPVAFSKWLNDPDNRFFRTRGGRV